MPQRLDRNEAIALAQQGKDAWNAWARRNPRASVDFSGADFTLISFSGFQFPGESNFSRVTFSDLAHFVGATFLGKADFTGATFPTLNDFTGATFSGFADFTGAAFSGRAYFTRTTFSDLTDFSESIFSSGADFIEATFSSVAYFDRATFASKADFTGATFSGKANFTRATFSWGVNFTGGSFSLAVNFGGASFGRDMDFSNRKFEGLTYFHGIIFSRAPLFYGASIHQGTIFRDIDKSFTDFLSEDAEHRYRTLKLAMGQHQARTEEAAFAALELKARRYRLKSEAKKMKLGWQRFGSWAERCGYWLWEKFSDSGRSFLRPFALYLAFWAAFAASYVLPCQGWLGDWWAGIHYAFLKQFPFAAAFRGGTNHFSNLENALFAATPLPGWVSALNSLQSLIALTLIFLMGLGIRHKFRLR